MFQMDKLVLLELIAQHILQRALVIPKELMVFVFGLKLLLEQQQQENAH